MPKANEKDLRDVPDEVKKQVTFTFVERMDEVLRLALLPPQRATPHHRTTPARSAARTRSPPRPSR